MAHPTNMQKSLAIIACLLITFSMGSLHAFSTLIENIEATNNWSGEWLQVWFTQLRLLMSLLLYFLVTLSTVDYLHFP